MSSQVAQFGTVFVEQESRLRRVIERIVGNRAVTDDIIQETYLKVSNALSRTEVLDHRGYLVRTATNLAFDYQRHLAISRPVDNSETALLTLADPEANPEAAVANLQAVNAATHILNKLPERTRRAFELHRLHERTMADIGRDLGISTALVHKLVTEAYTALRQELQTGGFLTSR